MSIQMPQFLAMGLVACYSLAACGRESTRDVLLRGSLRNAIVDAGFSCERDLESSHIEARGESWHVNCGNAEAYLVSMRSEDGSVCVEPVYSDNVLGVEGALPEPRCLGADGAVSSPGNPNE